MINVGIAEDHDLVRAGVVNIINGFEEIEVVAEGANGKELIDSFDPDNLPDVLLLDLEMPVMDGYDTAQYVKKKHPAIKLLGLSQHDSDRYIVHFIKCGGVGYLLKNVSNEELETAIKKSYYSGYYINEKVTFKMLKGMNERYKYKPGFSSEFFTPTEKEVLQHMCEGKKSSEIAEILGKSVRTVENHRANMMEKLGVGNAIQLVVTALQKEYIILEELNGKQEGH